MDNLTVFSKTGLLSASLEAFPIVDIFCVTLTTIVLATDRCFVWGAYKGTKSNNWESPSGGTLASRGGDVSWHMSANPWVDPEPDRVVGPAPCSPHSVIGSHSCTGTYCSRTTQPQLAHRDRTLRRLIALALSHLQARSAGARHSLCSQISRRRIHYDMLAAYCA